jgi:hypothetical protein
MSGNDAVTGEIEIREDDWTWSPSSLIKKNAQRLSKDINFVKKVNPASGVTFLRHLPKAIGCSEFLEDENKFAKCVIEMNKL